VLNEIIAPKATAVMVSLGCHRSDGDGNSGIAALKKARSCTVIHQLYEAGECEAIRLI
jgi:hypothetical protein